MDIQKYFIKDSNNRLLKNVPFKWFFLIRIKDIKKFDRRQETQKLQF